MKHTISKRLISLAMCITMLLGYATLANASTHTCTTSTSNGSKVANMNEKENVNPGAHTCWIKLTGVSFYGGQPANTFPAYGSVTIYIENTGVNTTYTSLNKTPRTSTYSVSSQKTTYSAVSASSGVTVFYQWNPNW